jgi:hypothetical protein
MWRSHVSAVLSLPGERPRCVVMHLNSDQGKPERRIMTQNPVTHENCIHIQLAQRTRSQTNLSD